LIELARASGTDAIRNQAATTAVSSEDAALALRAIAARGTGLPPVWTSVYTGLTGLYHRRVAPEIAGAFETALGAGTVGAQIASKPDRSLQLAGDTWFPHAGSYAEYLRLARSDDAAEYVRAEVEARPYEAASYMTLGDGLRDAGRQDAAMIEYSRALQLDPTRAGAHSQIASILAARGDLPEAQARWRTALDEFHRMQNGRLPETFWTEVTAALNEIGRYKSLPAVRNEADRVIRTYIRRTGAYRLAPLLEAAFTAAGGGAAGVDWLVELARAAKDPLATLNVIAGSDWLPAGAREPLYTRMIALSEAELTRRTGENRQGALYSLRAAQLRYIEALLEVGKAEQAWTILQSIDEEWKRSSAQADILETRAAAVTNRLDTLLRTRAEDASRDVNESHLRQAATALRAASRPADAAKILEFIYRRELDTEEPSASAFLGLAEIELERKNLAGALALLRRMPLVTSDPFGSFEPAAALLERFGHTAEAREFRQARVRSAPWDRAAAVALARSTKDITTLRALAADRQTPYESRASAANALSGDKALGSVELDLLAQTAPIAVAQAEQRYFFHARVKAASQASSAPVRVRLVRGALAINPDAGTTRPLLFDAALAARQPHTAVAVWHTLLADSSVGYWLSEERDGSRSARHLAQDFLSGAGLDVSQRASIAQGLARAFRDLERRAAARLMLGIAGELNPALSVDAELRLLNESIRIEEENRRRMPLIRSALEQPGRVRPKIIAGGVQ
jgi:hypothetical protein